MKCAYGKTLTTTVSLIATAIELRFQPGGKRHGSKVPTTRSPVQSSVPYMKSKHMAGPAWAAHHSAAEVDSELNWGKFKPSTKTTTPMISGPRATPVGGLSRTTAAVVSTNKTK